MLKIAGVALGVALVIGTAGCSDNGPSDPLDTGAEAPPVAPPAVPPVVPPVTPPSRDPRSPLGQIAYVDGAIALINSDGSGGLQLASGASPDWSPDGRRLIFSNTQCETDWDTYYECLSGGLVVIDAETRDTTRVRNSELGEAPAWSPRGDLIAFVRSAHANRLFIVRLDGSELRELSFPQVGEIYEPAWSPDGTRIVFQCMTASGSGVCVTGVDGSGFRQLTAPSEFAAGPAWSPRGDLIAFQFWNRQKHTAEIALMATDGTAVTRIAEGFSPVWSSDGTRLVFAGESGGLFISNADGSGVIRLTQTGYAPAWRPHQ